MTSERAPPAVRSARANQQQAAAADAAAYSSVTEYASGTGRSSASATWWPGQW